MSRALAFAEHLGAFRLAALVSELQAFAAVPTSYLDEAAPWPGEPLVFVYKGQSAGKSEHPVDVPPRCTIERRSIATDYGSAAIEEALREVILCPKVATAISAKAVELQRAQERRTMEALGLIPAERDRRTLLLDWSTPDPRQEAARREAEERDRERRARFRHPDGPCSHRPTGSKRSRRRRQGRCN